MAIDNTVPVYDANGWPMQGVGNVYVTSSSGSQLIKNGSGVCMMVAFTGGTAGSVKLFDAITPTGTPKVDFDSAAAAPGIFPLFFHFATGLVIQCSAATKLTLTFL